MRKVSELEDEGRRTRVVCTIGPACREPRVLRELVREGMDVARLHFSYGSHEEHVENIRHIREAADDENRSVAILQDLSGSKVRLKALSQETVTLEEGAEFTLTARAVEGDASVAAISVPELIRVVQPGDRILLNDGALELEAAKIGETDIRCQVVRGGRIKAHQAVHVPGRTPNVQVPTAKDFEDVLFGLQQEVDWIALSYLRNSHEVSVLRHFIHERGASTPVIAKIERREALDDLDKIIAAADGIMVARGDLGLELPIERIGLIQKDIIRRCRAAGKVVVTATEMLTSMMTEPRPTRAEVTDITNAILDGTDAVMLSGETAVGRYPVESLRMMVRVNRVVDDFLARNQ